MRAVVLMLMLSGCFKAPVVYAESKCLVHTEQALDADKGKPRHWYKSDFPIQLVPSGVVTKDEMSAVREAAMSWNVVAGFEVFTLEGKSKSLVPVFFSKIAIAPGKEIAGFGPSSVDKDGHINHALVLIDPDLKSHVLDSVVTHELGHVLGLQHDPDNEFSIMHPHGLGLVVWPDDAAYIKSENRECNERQP